MSTEPEHFRRSPRQVTVAATQMCCDWEPPATSPRRKQLVREAAARGAQIILLPELFEAPYFCIEQDSRHLRLARSVDENRAVRHFSAVARELGVVLPISFFERAGQAYFNSIAIIDADGRNLGLYRKSHIPNGPGLPGEDLLQPRRHRLQGVEHAVRAHRCRDLLGSVVPGDLARHGAAGRGAAVLPDGDRLASRRRRCLSTRATTGSAPSRGMPRRI